MTPRPAADLDRRFHAFAVDRLLAWAVDGLVVLLAWRFLGERPATAIAVVLAAVLLGFVALAVLLGRTGTSPGNALLGVRVRSAGDGAPIGVGPALLRQLVLELATLPTLGLGTATLAWTAAVDPGGRRHGWHDRLVGSEVIDVRPLPAEPVPEPEAPRGVVNLTALRLVPPPPPPSTPTPSTPTPSTPTPSTPTPSTPAPPPAGPATTITTRTPEVAEQPTPPRRPPQHRAPASASASADPAPGRPRLGHPLLPEPAGPGARWRVSFDSGESIVVDGLTLVGRRPEPRTGESPQQLLALPSDDMSLSKTHAQLQVAADGVLVVTDRGSTNGSVLLRRGVPRELAAGRPTTLLDADHVRFGDRMMSVAREV